jgi:N-acetylglucosaminyl-diphospho-decaprenol L-rhamnosyltransferase
MLRSVRKRILHSQMTSHDVTIVVVTYNSAHCVPALAKSLQDFPHLIVSDNASADDTRELVSRLLPQAHCIVHPSNLGFGVANNRALAQVTTPFALLLNPDCEITPHQVLQLIEAAHQFPEAALLAPQLIDIRGQADVNYRWPRTYWADQSSMPGAEGPCSVGYACGAALLVRLAACQGVGWFDEDYFLYYEDDDWCLRLFNARRGIVIVPHVHCVHANRGSVRGKHPIRAEYWRGFHHARSKLLFTSKHASQGAEKRLWRKTLWLGLLSFPLRLLTFNPKLLARHWGRLHALISIR